MPISGEQIDVQVVVRCGCAVVTLRGDLDAATGLQFEAVVAGIVRVPGVARLEVDGRQLQFVDSSGVYALLRARADALAAGVACFLGPASPALRRILDLTGVGTLHDASMN